MKRKIIETIKREYVNGNYRYNITDLPWEIHFRLGCRWEEANDIANDIRVGEKIMNKKCQCKQCMGMDEY